MLFRGHMGPYHTRQAVAVGHRERAITQLGRLLHKLLCV